MLNLLAGKDFDPNQPRDPHTGEWIGVFRRALERTFPPEETTSREGNPAFTIDHRNYGWIIAEYEGSSGDAFVSGVEVPTELQGQGNGTDLYVAAALKAAKGGGVLRSSDVEYSDAAQALWGGLVRRGLAKREGDRYVMDLRGRSA